MRWLIPGRLTRPILTLTLTLSTLVFGSTVRAEEIHGWGKLHDPDGGTRVVRSNNGIELIVPGAYRDLWPAGGMNAPRVLQRVRGDFAIQVKVIGEVDVTGRTLAVKRPPKARFIFRGACLVIWHDEQNFVRLDRSSTASRPAAWSYQAHDRGRLAASQSGELRPEEPTWLRIQRKDGVVYAWYRQTGDDSWTATEVERLSLPDEVSVGVAVVNTTSSPFSARFEGFVVEN